ncbi:MAG TPA: thiamine phosphate synthase [Alphaproteobacteria bacterium]|nr:thiamine phosphate synthase [Alphaproteobacteria bacterium]
MTGIYLITPPKLESSFPSQLNAALEAGDVACVQLRLKGASDDEWRKAIKELMPICAAREIAFLLNDRADLAKEMGCDGVHVGQHDMPYDDARKLLGPDKIIGVSAYASKDTAMELAAAGADYVAFGSVFPSVTKEHAPPVPLSVLEDWAAMATTPCAAIGGITAENCAPLVRAGVDFLAVISAVWNHEGGPAAGVRALQAAIEAAKV